MFIFILYPEKGEKRFYRRFSGSQEMYFRFQKKFDFLFSIPRKVKKKALPTKKEIRGGE